MLKLETTADKIIIRRELLAQTFEFVKLHDEFTINSLPASSWKWEDNLINHLNMVHPNKKADLICYDFDKNLKEFFPYPIEKEMVLNQCYGNPILLTAQNGNVNVRGIYGTGFCYHSESDKPCLAWADYCGNPSKEILNDFKKAVRVGDVIYVTFNLSWRCSENVAQRLIKSKKEIGAAETILVEMENIIKDKIGNNFTRIYFCSYVGNRAPMVTIGWHFVANSPIKPMHNERHKVKAAIVKANHVEPVKQLIRDGIADEEIFKQWPNLTPMKLAGCKAAVKREQNKI